MSVTKSELDAATEACLGCVCAATDVWAHVTRCGLFRGQLESPLPWPTDAAKRLAEAYRDTNEKMGEAWAALLAANGDAPLVTINGMNYALYHEAATGFAVNALMCLGAANLVVPLPDMRDAIDAATDMQWERLHRVIQGSVDDPGDVTAGIWKEWANAVSQLPTEGNNARKPSSKGDGKPGNKADPEVAKRNKDWRAKYDKGVRDGTYKSKAEFHREVDPEGTLSYSAVAKILAGLP